MAEMNNKKKDLNVPPLRFPEFKGEWETIRASDLLETFSTNSLTWDELNYDAGSMKDVHYGLIHQRFDSAIVDANSDLIPFIKPGKEPRKYTPIEEGDIVLADASEDVAECGEPVEFSSKCNYPLVSGLHTIHCRDKLGMTVPGFKSFLFSSLPVKRQIAHLCEGTKIYSISNGTLRELWLNIPEKKEQEEITRLLEKIDERIRVQRKTIEDWKNIKSHIVNSEFSACTEPLAISIEEVSERYKSCDENYEVFSVSNIKGFTRQAEQFEGKAIAGENKSNYKIVRSGVFAYNPARINVGSIARYSGVRPVIVSPMYICFQAKKNYRPEYLAYFFISNSFTKQMNSLLEGSVRQCLLFDSLRQIKLPQRDASKQKDFVEKVKMIDALICCETYFFEKLKTMKEYLLRDLFT